MMERFYDNHFFNFVLCPMKNSSLLSFRGLCNNLNQNLLDSLTRCSIEMPVLSFVLVLFSSFYNFLSLARCYYLTYSPLLFPSSPSFSFTFSFLGAQKLSAMVCHWCYGPLYFPFLVFRLRIYELHAIL